MLHSVRGMKHKNRPSVSCLINRRFTDKIEFKGLRKEMRIL
jgi:hypothetical protein